LLFHRDPGGTKIDGIARFEWFWKLRSRIYGSGCHMIVGIDIAKDKKHAFFGTAKGQSLWRRSDQPGKVPVL
jgi:hypothetical protein